MPLKLTSSRQSILVTRVAFWLPEESNVQRNKERMGFRAAISNSSGRVGTQMRRNKRLHY